MTTYHDRLQAGNYTVANPDDLEEQTVADLKTQLSDRGLSVSGTKAELIERLATPTTDE